MRINAIDTNAKRIALLTEAGRPSGATLPCTQAKHPNATRHSTAQHTVVFVYYNSCLILLCVLFFVSCSDIVSGCSRAGPAAVSVNLAPSHVHHEGEAGRKGHEQKVFPDREPSQQRVYPLLVLHEQKVGPRQVCQVERDEQHRVEL